MRIFDGISMREMLRVEVKCVKTAVDCVTLHDFPSSLFSMVHATPNYVFASYVGDFTIFATFFCPSRHLMEEKRKKAAQAFSNLIYDDHRRIYPWKKISVM